MLRLTLSTLSALLIISVANQASGASAESKTTSGPTVDSLVVDIDSNIYHTVTIGTQTWMVENLKVTRYRDGSPIDHIADDSAWGLATSGAYCWYDNDSSAFKDTYGALYNFHAVTDSRNLCPEGWHVPTREDWLVLQDYLGGPDTAGGKAKEAAISHWTKPNVSATDEYGFCGLPGGGRGRFVGFGEIGNYATWWSSTAHDSAFVWHWGLYYGNGKIRFNPGHKASGFSVRCVKD